MRDITRTGRSFHHQIAQVLRARLESGAWPGGDAPATEQALCREFNASRTTVRQALSQLKQAGMLESRTGVGTRGIAIPGRRKVVRANGDPLHAGLNGRARVVAHGIVAAPPAVAGFFGMSAGEPIWHFVRVYDLDGKPLSVVDSYLPRALGVSFTRTLLKRPMQELLWQHHGLRLHRSVHTVRIGRADLDVAAWLGIELADPVLRIQSSVYLEDDTPIRWTDNAFVEGRYEYVADMEWPAPHGEPAALRTALRAPPAATATRSRTGTAPRTPHVR